MSKTSVSVKIMRNVKNKNELILDIKRLEEERLKSIHTSNEVQEELLKRKAELDKVNRDVEAQYGKLESLKKEIEEQKKKLQNLESRHNELRGQFHAEEEKLHNLISDRIAAEPVNEDVKWGDLNRPVFEIAKSSKVQQVKEEAWLEKFTGTLKANGINHDQCIPYRTQGCRLFTFGGAGRHIRNRQKPFAPSLCQSYWYEFFADCSSAPLG